MWVGVGLPVDEWTMRTILRGRGSKVEAVIDANILHSHFFIKDSVIIQFDVGI